MVEPVQQQDASPVQAQKRVCLLAETLVGTLVIAVAVLAVSASLLHHNARRTALYFSPFLPAIICSIVSGFLASIGRIGICTNAFHVVLHVAFIGSVGWATYDVNQLYDTARLFAVVALVGVASFVNGCFYINMVKGAVGDVENGPIVLHIICTCVSRMYGRFKARPGQQAQALQGYELPDIRSGFLNSKEICHMCNQQINDSKLTLTEEMDRLLSDDDLSTLV